MYLSIPNKLIFIVFAKLIIYHVLFVRVSQGAYLRHLHYFMYMYLNV